MGFSSWLFIIILFASVFVSYKTNKLTLTGSITGGVVACSVFFGGGYTGLFLLGSFFLLGTLATSWKIRVKETLGAAEDNKGRRTAGQVIANGGVAGIMGLLAFIFPAEQRLFQVMMAAALSSATADTLSSELGTLYGKKFYNILNFQYDKRGENGVVSIEGILIGIAGSTLIATIYALGVGWGVNVGWIIIAGTIGNIADSVFGATLERKGYVKNNTVNFLNTLVAALAVMLLRKL
ncbi:MAG: DUF92 domain-containing protein [Ferruginibacter sp.]